MSKKVSELMNGQLDSRETQDALSEISNDADLRDRFTLYGLILGLWQ